MIANEGNTSESGKALAQQLKVQLEEAERALEETEYEKYLSDQRELLDSLTLEYEEWMNQRMDDENALLEQIIGEIATEGDQINATLNEVAEKNGTLISNSITFIFDAQSPFTNALTSISNGVAGTTTAINNLIAQVQNIAGIIGSTNAGMSSGSNVSSSSSSSSSSVSGGASSHSSSSTSSSSASQKTTSSSGNDNIFIYKKDGYPKSKLDKEQSIVDRCKYFDFDSSFQARASYYSKLGGSGSYRGSASQNRWLIQKMKERGYKKGSSNIPFDQMNWVHDGEIVLKRVSDDGYLTDLPAGSKVLTEKQANNMLNWSKMNPQVLTPNVSIPSMPVVQSRQVQTSPQIHDVNMTFELPNVKNTDDFINDMIRSKRFENVIHSITFGKNSMDKFKHLK